MIDGRLGVEGNLDEGRTLDFVYPSQVGSL